jgi:hypothetical protein
VIEERGTAKILDRRNIIGIETVGTPHPSLPLKGGGEEIAGRAWRRGSE